MNIIAYLLYGTRREYHLELTYSVLSAVRYLGANDHDYRIVLVTDDSNQRFDLPIDHLIFSADEFNEWTRDGTYNHEAKAHALRKLCNTFDGKIALVDTDTYFTSHPSLLFNKIDIRHSVMHASDGILSQYPDWLSLLSITSSALDSYKITRNSEMMNSGVVGIHCDNARLIDDVIDLIRILHGMKPVFNIEQFAFTVLLSKNTSLTVCQEVVHHYWGIERRFAHATIGLMFPTFSSKLFEHCTLNFRTIGIPRKTIFNKARARAKALWRCRGGDYRFAYLAYLSALTSAATNPTFASAWSDTCLDMLQMMGLRDNFIKYDFRHMRDLKRTYWLEVEGQRRWVDYFANLD